MLFIIPFASVTTDNETHVSVYNHKTYMVKLPCNKIMYTKALLYIYKRLCFLRRGRNITVAW